MKTIKNEKYNLLDSNEMNVLNGGRCETTRREFLGRTYVKTVCYNDIDGDRESVCRSKDYA